MNSSSRREFVKLAGLALAAAPIVGCQKEEASNAATLSDSSKKQKKRKDAPLPVLFVGHGSPVNGMEKNKWSSGFASLAHMIPRPKAILAISAHWYVDGTWLTGSSSPKTIHDFYGFPRSFYEVNYPAPGNGDLAKRVKNILSAYQSEVRNDWGLDHGTWTVLRHIYPDASIPVIQLSVDKRLSPNKILEASTSLQSLRHDGVLIFASGNITHNLQDALTRMSSRDTTTPPWAERFDEAVVTAVTQRDASRLGKLVPGTKDGRIAHPSPDHWLPLLYAFGATHKDDTVHFPIQGFDAGSLSMRSILFS